MRYRIVEVNEPGQETYYLTQKRILGIFWISMHSECYMSGSEMRSDPKRFGTYKSAEEALREEVTTYGKVVRIFHCVDV